MQSYRCDAQGTVIGLSDGNGNRTRFAVDEWGRITEIHNPDGGVESYTYDLQGNLLEEGDGETAKRYRYNVLSQQTQVEMKAFLQKNHYKGQRQLRLQH